MTTTTKYYRTGSLVNISFGNSSGYNTSVSEQLVSPLVLPTGLYFERSTTNLSGESVYIGPNLYPPTRSSLSLVGTAPSQPTSLKIDIYWAGCGATGSCWSGTATWILEFVDVDLSVPDGQVLDFSSDFLLNNQLLVAAPVADLSRQITTLPSNFTVAYKYGNWNRSDYLLSYNGILTIPSSTHSSSANASNVIDKQWTGINGYRSFTTTVQLYSLSNTYFPVLEREVTVKLAPRPYYPFNLPAKLTIGGTEAASRGLSGVYDLDEGTIYWNRPVWRSGANRIMAMDGSRSGSGESTYLSWGVGAYGWLVYGGGVGAMYYGAENKNAACSISATPWHSQFKLVNGSYYDPGTAFTASTAQFDILANASQSPEIVSGAVLQFKVGETNSKLVSLVDPNGFSENFSATGLPGGLFIQSKTGEIHGTPVSAGTYTCQVTAQNFYGTSSKQVVVVVEKGTASISIQQAYEHTGGPITALVTVVPDWLSYTVTYNGAAQKPIDRGSYSVTVTINDADYAGSVTNTIFVTDFNCRVGEVVTSVISRDWPVTSWAASGVPPGLRLNSETGVLYGTPTVIGTFTTTFSLRHVTAIAAGQYHSLALKSDGKVVGWGTNTYGQVSIPNGLSDVVAISAGLLHSLALKSNGTVVAWGQDYGLNGVTDVVAISAGDHHSLALKSNGTVVAAGDFLAGAALIIPSGLSNVVSIAASNRESYALKSDGTVVAWGTNLSPVAGLSGVVAIARAIDGGIIALKSDGTVVVPGGGTVSGISNVVAVARGFNGAFLALKSDGKVVAWGNIYSSLTSVPSGLSNVAAISAGTHALVLKKDGTLVAWGDNSNGQRSIPNTLAATRSATYRVSEGAPRITLGQTASGKIGTAFSKTFLLTDSTNRPATSWSAGNLPGGLSINSSTGAVTGTPTTAGSYSASITANGPGGTSGATPVSFTIEKASSIFGLGANNTSSSTNQVRLGSTLVSSLWLGVNKLY